MEWLKKHTDAVIVISEIIASVLWMNGKFNELDHHFNEIEKDICIIKTIMIMKQIMPSELVKIPTEGTI